MTAANRMTFSIAAIAFLLTTAAIWSISNWSDASDDVNRAASDLRTTRSLVNDIIALRPTSLNTDSQGDPAARLPGLIDNAMKSAEIEAENLDRISPQPARPIGRSSVMEIPTQLVFREISLHQQLAFVVSLVRGNDWICVRDLHLQHPAGVAGQGSNVQWNVEMTISYLTAQQTAFNLTAAAAN